MKNIISIFTVISLSFTICQAASEPSASPQPESKQKKEFFGSTLSLVSPPPATPASDQVAAESKRANEFLDKVFDEFVASHPQIESSLGIKTHYDQWNVIPDKGATARSDM